MGQKKKKNSNGESKQKPLINIFKCLKEKSHTNNMQDLSANKYKQNSSKKNSLHC